MAMRSFFEECSLIYLAISNDSGNGLGPKLTRFSILGLNLNRNTLWAKTEEDKAIMVTKINIAFISA